MEEGSPGLALLLRWSSSPPILLDRALTHTNTQLEQVPSDPLRPHRQFSVAMVVINDLLSSEMRG